MLFIFYMFSVVGVGAILRFADITGWVAVPIIVVFAVVLAFGFWPRLYTGEDQE